MRIIFLSFSMLRSLGIFLLISLFFSLDLSAQSRHRSFTVKEVVGNERRSTRVDLAESTRLVILQKKTTKRDRYGTLARLRLLEETEYPENNASGIEQIEDDVMVSSRSRERYPLTDASSNVYFIYALTPDGKVLQSVAWSTTRNQYEPAFERFVGQELDLLPLRDATRIESVLAKYFDGASPTARTADPVISTAADLVGTDLADAAAGQDEVDDQVVAPTPGPRTDFSANANTDAMLAIRLSEITGDRELPLRSLPTGSSVALFRTDADLGSTGYTFVPLPNSENPFPESTQARPEFATLNSASGGPELSRRLPKTDAINPNAYFLYAMTPGGKVYQSAGKTAKYFLPAYEIVENGTFIMMPVLDADRTARIKEIYWTSEKDYSWLYWLIPGFLALLGLVWGLARHGKKQEKAAEKEWQKMSKKRRSRQREKRPEGLSSAANRKKAPILEGRYRIFEKADDAYFENEVDPLIRDDQKLRDSIVLYRNQIKENIETIFLEDFEKNNPTKE